MFWFMDDKPATPGKELSKIHQADLDRLGKNGEIAADLQTRVITRTRDEAFARHNIPGQGDIYVSAHGGLDSGEPAHQPYISGLDFTDFADALVTKCGGAANLGGRTLWLLVCDIGQRLADLAQQFAAKGVRSLTLYAPKPLVFISTEGIPHVYMGSLESKAVDAQVATNRAEFLTLEVISKDYKGTGVGWAGVQLTDGQATAIAADETEDAIKTRFDPNEEEWS